MKTIIISGGSGFIGVNLAKIMREDGHRVICIDKIKRDIMDNTPNIEFFLANLADEGAAFNILASIKNLDFATTEVWHLAANSDIPAGIYDAKIDYQDTFMTSMNLGLAMQKLGLKTLLFASSSAVYGDHGDAMISEITAPLLPISNYGAMKLASEAIFSAFAEQFIEKLVIFRFPNVVGAPATHGIIYDLIHKLRHDNKILPILGDGSQKKSYLHVLDLIKAMRLIHEKNHEKRAIFNIAAADEGIYIREIAQMVQSMLAPNCQIIYGTGNKGWLGDVPKFAYDISKLQNLGFQAKFNSHQAVKLAIQEIAREIMP